ncbi:uncharacterized protein [Hoplias malabaricus]|uniref:uncharacterized protein isoform X1 n=1 Tax=Hoplias malabaricus TaxID=27720 RepID=UPI00346354F8
MFEINFFRDSFWHKSDSVSDGMVSKLNHVPRAPALNSVSPEYAFLRKPESARAFARENYLWLRPCFMELDVSLSMISSGSTSSDSMTSTFSFTTAPSSAPADRCETPPRQESLMPLQKSFAQHKDEGSQGLDTSQVTTKNLTPNCPDLTLTIDDATDAMPFKSQRRESAVDLDICEDGNAFLSSSEVLGSFPSGLPGCSGPARDPDLLCIV